MRSDGCVIEVYGIPGLRSVAWDTRVGFVFSHPCGRKKPQGWGTELFDSIASFPLVGKRLGWR